MMPPSPALRFSPGRELKEERNHKRGRSLESGLSFKAKDDDLTLFNEMQTKENDNFLLQSSEDLDDSLLKLRGLSEYNLGIKIPTRRESDLLCADGGKNDYDWLLTPPETPLFPSLDDVQPAHPNLVTRGRLRSHSTSISRLSAAEQHQRPSRSIASPHRRSPSPCPGTATVQSRGRASSVPRSNPAPILRSTASTRRSPTPPNRSSTPTPRSSTPTLRMNSLSSGQTPLAVRRGTSPIKGSRGGSSSPKIQAWQSNIPGFSLDAPPNLRTSISDRPATYSRGSSPSSRNGKEYFPRSSRQSMSPTASRSASSSQSHDHDFFSLHSKGSVASSGDDDVDSLRSSSAGISASSISRRNSILVSNRTITFSKKPSSTVAVASVPKRSIDSAIRQMDHHRTPQNMFRPLMSNVPPSSFLGGKTSTLHHRPIFSRNSSLTTSSNGSSELGASIVPDTEGDDHEHADLTGNWDKVLDSNLKDQFSFDKTKDISEDVKDGVPFEESPDVHESLDGNLQRNFLLELESFTSNSGEVEVTTAPSEDLFFKHGTSKHDSNETLVTCSICGESFQILEKGSSNTGICQRCAVNDEIFGALLAKTANLSSPEEGIHQMEAHTIDEFCDHPLPQIDIAESPGKNSSSEGFVSQHTEKSENIEQNPDVPQVSSVTQSSCDLGLVYHHVENKEQKPDVPGESFRAQLGMTGNSHEEWKLQKIMSSFQYGGDYNNLKQSRSLNLDSKSNVDGSELTGNLKRSNSSKGFVAQGRAFAASSSLYSEPLYAREHIKASKLNISRNSSSTSSSLDLGSSKNMEHHVRRQLSSRKAGMDNLISEMKMRSQSSSLSLSSTTCSNSLESPVQATNLHTQQNTDTFLSEYGAAPSVIVEEGRFEGDAVYSSTPSSAKRRISFEDGHYTRGCPLEVSISESSSSYQSIHLDLTAPPVSDFQIYEDNLLPEDSDSEVDEKERKMCDSVVTVDLALKDDDNSEGATCKSSLSKLEIKQVDDSLEISQVDRDNCLKVNDNDILLSHSGSVSSVSEKDRLLTHLDSDTDNHAQNIHEEPTVTVEGLGGQKIRSLTLEEATETILFCSSLVRDLAHKAATIGVEKEQPVVPEVPQPMVTIPDKRLSDERGHSETQTRKTFKSQKVKRRKQETEETNATSNEHVKDIKAEESNKSDPNPPCKVQSTKPPKLESKCGCTVM